LARTQHTYAKRQREIEKKRKADEKRERRRMKNRPAEAAGDEDALNETDNPVDAPEPPPQ